MKHDEYLKRGERLYPSKKMRNYWVLTELRKSYEHILEDELSDQKELVDYGCGAMPYRPLFEEKGICYRGFDFKGNDMAEDNLTSDGNLPLSDFSCEIVLSSQVLEHVTSPHSYLKEAHRVLKENGLLLLSTHGVWRYHPDPTDYWRWTGDGLVKAISDSGFKVSTINGIVGPAATAIQLFQDAVLTKSKRFMQPILFYFCQTIMEFIDKRCSEVTKSRDASVYIVVARKIT